MERLTSEAAKMADIVSVLCAEKIFDLFFSDQEVALVASHYIYVFPNSYSCMGK